MSLIDNLRARPGAKAAQAQAPDVLRKLREAEAALADLETRHGEAALDAIITGASGPLDALARSLANAREKVATLRSAHQAAISRDEATLRSQRVALHKTQMLAMRKHLEARDAAAVALSAAIEEATKQWHTLLDRSAKARAACPIGATWPGGALCAPDEIRPLVAHELFRLSATPGNRDGRALPGSELPHTQFQWNPTAIPAMADKLKQASAFVIAKLKGKDAE